MVRAIRRRVGFPWTAAPWPAALDRPRSTSALGVDYDTAWARRPAARLVRLVALETLGLPALHALARPRVVGADRLIGLEGPVVFAANHASHLDSPLVIAGLPERFRHRTVFAAGADYFFDRPWKAHASALFLNAIPIERTKVSRSAAELPAALLAEGWSLVIYPEGGRTPDGWSQGHRGGAAFVASRAGVPVVPVWLEGTYDILPKGASRPRPGHTSVCFGRPLVLRAGEDARRFAQRIEQALDQLADEQSNGWWVARRRAGDGHTPSTRGPEAAPWRRAWTRPGAQSSARDRTWPKP